MGIVFLLSMTRPEFLQLLDLDPQQVLRGQAWRLVTYLFLPQATSMIWVFVKDRFIAILLCGKARNV